MQIDPKTLCMRIGSQDLLSPLDLDDSNKVSSLTSLVKDVEDNMLLSFETLVTDDQQAVIDRLNSMSHKLQGIKAYTLPLDTNTKDISHPVPLEDPIEGK
ncbi:UNVERIFIED_CONTAM: hypothetical protein K2H54_056589 [Gekko kuhli]